MGRGSIRNVTNVDSKIIRIITENRLKSKDSIGKVLSENKIEVNPDKLNKIVYIVNNAEKMQLDCLIEQKETIYSLHKKIKRVSKNMKTKILDPLFESYEKLLIKIKNEINQNATFKNTEKFQIVKGYINILKDMFENEVISLSDLNRFNDITNKIFNEEINYFAPYEKHALNKNTNEVFIYAGNYLYVNEKYLKSRENLK